MSNNKTLYSLDRPNPKTTMYSELQEDRTDFGQYRLDKQRSHVFNGPTLAINKQVLGRIRDVEYGHARCAL